MSAKARLARVFQHPGPVVCYKCRITLDHPWHNDKIFLYAHACLCPEPHGPKALPQEVSSELFCTETPNASTEVLLEDDAEKSRVFTPGVGQRPDELLYYCSLLLQYLELEALGRKFWRYHMFETSVGRPLWQECPRIIWHARAF